MHSLLDRSTILAGLVDELRPLLPPLSGALSDLCTGIGRAEAAEQALETAFMIRASAEMLELETLAEAGRLVEAVVPILHGAPRSLHKDSQRVVQSILATLGQATEALLGSVEQPTASLGAVRSAVERLDEARRAAVEVVGGPDVELEAMLATLPVEQPTVAAADVRESVPQAVDHWPSDAAATGWLDAVEDQPPTESGGLPPVPVLPSEPAGELDERQAWSWSPAETDDPTVTVAGETAELGLPAAHDAPTATPAVEWASIETVELAPPAADSEPNRQPVPSIERIGLAGETPQLAATDVEPPGLLPLEPAGRQMEPAVPLAVELSGEAPLDPSAVLAEPPTVLADVPSPAEGLLPQEPLLETIPPAEVGPTRAEVAEQEPGQEPHPARIHAAPEPSLGSPLAVASAQNVPLSEKVGLFQRFLRGLRGRPGTTPPAPAPERHPVVPARPTPGIAPSPAAAPSPIAPAPTERVAATLVEPATGPAPTPARRVEMLIPPPLPSLPEPVEVPVPASVAPDLAVDPLPETRPEAPAVLPTDAEPGPVVGGPEFLVPSTEEAPPEVEPAAWFAPSAEPPDAPLLSVPGQIAEQSPPLEADWFAEALAASREETRPSWDRGSVFPEVVPDEQGPETDAVASGNEPLVLSTPVHTSAETIAEAPLAEPTAAEVVAEPFGETGWPNAWREPTEPDDQPFVLDQQPELQAQVGGLDQPQVSIGTPSAPEIDAEILEVFVIEAEELLGDIRRQLAAVQVDPGERQAAAELRRACHTLKGAANVVGFTTIGRVCKAMEDLLDALAEAEASADPPALGFLERSFDAVQGLVARAADPSLLALADRLAEEGAELTVRVGVAEAGTALPTDTPDSVAWARAVDAFLADANVEPEASADRIVDVQLDPAIWQPVPPSSAPAQLQSEGEGVDAGQRSELVAIFAEEAQEHLAALSGAALRLDLSPADAEALAEARRVLHTLKGAAGALELDTISGFCHETESRLDAEPANTAARLLFDAAEGLEQALRQLAETGQEPSELLIQPLDLPEAALLPSPAPVVDPLAVAERPVEAPAEPVAEVADQPSSAGAVRVDLSRVDELMSVVGEMVLSRTGLEQRLVRIARSAEELRLTVARLRRVAQYLEDRYEVAELIRTTPEEPRPGGGEFDELEMDRYTELHRVSREVTELSADAATTSDEIDLALKELDSLLIRQARLGTELQDKLMAVRLVPLSTLATRLHRTVRSVGLRQDKQVELVVQGAETELDKRVLEELGDILVHLLRNAVDHGLERPDDRVSRGKPAGGTISLRAFREGSEVVIQASDDGAGVDLRRVRQRAEVLGLIDPHRDLDEQDILDLIFHPGLSTSQVASEISGRGVGLDAVRAAVGRLKGSISVSSEPGQGTTFTLRLPVVLAVLQAMLVKAGDQAYAIPMAALERVTRLVPRLDASLGRTPLLEMDGEAFPFLELGPVLGQASTRRAGDEVPVLLVRTGERRVALAVDDLLGQDEVVVKPLGPHLRHVRGVLGASIQPGGQLLLVLNTAELLTARVLLVGGRRTPSQNLETQPIGGLSALVVDDSLSVRKVLARALERAGWEVRQARDGVNALEVLQSFRPHVVLADIEMPRMDGFELTGVLRDVADYGHPPVVMITSRAGEKHRKRAEELGVAGYVVKPYQETELLTLLSSVAAHGTRR